MIGFLDLSYLFSAFAGIIFSSSFFLVVIWYLFKRSKAYVPQPLPKPQTLTLPEETPAESTNETGLEGHLVTFLSNFQVFGYFEETILLEIIKHTQTVKLNKGEVINDLESNMYIVSKGTIEVHSDKSLNEDTVIKVVKEGEVISSLFNILALITEQNLSSGSVIAVSPQESTVVKLPLHCFIEIGQKFPNFIPQMVQVIITRFQRVTFMSLNRYFGFTSELVNTDENLTRNRVLPQKPFIEQTETELRSFASSIFGNFFGIESLKDIEKAIVFEKYEEDQVIVKRKQHVPGLYLVVEGELQISMFDFNLDEKVIYHVKAGGLAGYLNIFASFPSFMEFKVKSKTRLAMLPKKSIEKLMNANPKSWVHVGKNIIPEYSPLIRKVDFALDWTQLNAAQVLFKQGEDSDSAYLVLYGRVRSVVKKETGETEIVGEFGQRDKFGDFEILTNISRESTVFAVRDCELAKIPKFLFKYLTLKHPQIMTQIGRSFALRSKNLTKKKIFQRNKTVAILPISSNPNIPVEKFSQDLLEQLDKFGPSLILNNSSVLHELGKNAFNRVGKLKLASWLEDLEENHRIILYVSDQPGTLWTKQCIRQADCILLLALSTSDPSEGDVEKFMNRMNPTARRELVLIHSQRTLLPGTTFKWLRNRPYIQLHHHILFENPTINLSSGIDRTFFGKRKIVNSKPLADIARVARYLTGKSVGLILGGGGARGFAHIGIIKALEEEGIPIDFVGGTSMGAFIGGLYCKDVDNVSVQVLARKFSSKLSAKWSQIMDLTYPITSWFSGRSFNRALRSCFSDQQIEDLWINYFCVTTNITKSIMEVHQSGTVWRYCRASMSLSGFMPPLCDQGNMLVDGGYVNNLPADVMRKIHGIERIIAVDVGASDDTEPMHYGDHLSGWWVLWASLPFGRRVRVPTLSDIQSKLAYVSSVKQLEEVKTIPGVLYVRPPIEGFLTLDFHKIKDLVKVGYAHGKTLIEKWKEEGIFEEFLQDKEASTPIMERRNSF